MNDKSTNQGPDCRTCWQRETCEKAQAGTFCALWATKQPQAPEHPDAWERGDDPWEGTV